MVNALWGLWFFTSLIYQGNSLPPPNPDLQISYHFEDSGINTLRYFRIGEQGFCERRAIYEFSRDTLRQQVVWLHPDNASWCGQDVDMQLGYESWSPAWLKNGKFHLAVMMGEENLIYVWERPPMKGP